MITLFLSSLFVLNSCTTSKKTVKHNGTAFNAIDYKQIKKAVNDKDSEFYYPELLRRFDAADTTLTREQAYYFYYGTATLPDYNPYKFENYEEVNKALSGDNNTEEHWQKAALAIEKQLHSDPTNLRFHVYKQMAYSYVYGKESQEYRDAVFQVKTLLSAIMASGDGRSKETAFHVISVTDEYGLMDILGVSLKMQSLINDKDQSYDLMELKENEYGLESLYFNTTVCMKAMNKMFSH
ncbi:MAG: DUF4919 domain-containing protein [Bacteroidales bacterium]|nr:DUF4919 domain-containing protein [Bacteroidales bacterium]